MHTWSRFLPITEARGVLCPNTQRLCPLLTGHVAGLVWVPYLFAVVAELGLAAFSLAHQFGAAGTSVGNHSITIGRKEGQDSQPGNKQGAGRSPHSNRQHSIGQQTLYWCSPQRSAPFNREIQYTSLTASQIYSDLHLGNCRQFLQNSYTIDTLWCIQCREWCTVRFSQLFYSIWSQSNSLNNFRKNKEDTK